MSTMQHDIGLRSGRILNEESTSSIYFDNGVGLDGSFGGEGCTDCAMCRFAVYEDGFALPDAAGECLVLLGNREVQ